MVLVSTCLEAGMRDHGQVVRRALAVLVIAVLVIAVAAIPGWCVATGLWW